jgi:hypothetical protein
MIDAGMPAAAVAFDAIADRFDDRFGGWASVAAQRAAIRRFLLDAFPAGSHLLELAGGTGEDALFLAARDRRVLLTDGSPAMVARAAAKVAAAGRSGRIDTMPLLLEDIETFAAGFLSSPPFNGAYSNFAGLNCIEVLRPVARGLANLLPAHAAALLVLFGPHPPGEALVQLARGDVRAAFRRSSPAAAGRLGGRSFRVFYHSPRRIAAAFHPWFRLRRRRGIGILVPPSAAEPFISRLPRFVDALAAADRVLASPLALLGDHVLYDFVRTAESAPRPRT